MIRSFSALQAVTGDKSNMICPSLLQNIPTFRTQFGSRKMLDSTRILISIIFIYPRKLRKSTRTWIWSTPAWRDSTRFRPEFHGLHYLVLKSDLVVLYVKCISEGGNFFLVYYFASLRLTPSFPSFTSQIYFSQWRTYLDVLIHVNILI
jgi:hypothetical protein